MLETKKAGRKILLVVCVFFLGVVTPPSGWNFWDFIVEVGHNPELTVPLLIGLAWLSIGAAVLVVFKNIKSKKKEE